MLEWYRTGGPLMLPLVIVGLAAAALLVDRISAAVRRSRINARPFMERVIGLARAGKVEDALALCAEHQSALPDLGLVVLRSGSNDPGVLLDVARVATLTAAPALTRRLSLMPALAVVALLLGALGGVVNLHDALAALPPGAASAVTAGAIAFALRPIGAALLTAIPLVAAHAILMHDARTLGAQLEEFAARLVHAMLQRPDVRLGHRS